MKIIQKIAILLLVLIIFDLLLAARSIGTGISTYAKFEYYTYFIIAIILSLVGCKILRIMNKQIIPIFLILVIISHCMCSIEETIFIKKYEKLGSKAKSRYFDGSCWLSYDIDRGQLKAGD